MKLNICIILIMFFIYSLYAQDSKQTFLSLRNTGVESFQKSHTGYDGRGTIILVLDTGVDMGVEGLTKTSTGDVKVIDVQDFTGQGDIEYFPAELEEENDRLFFINEENGYKLEGANDISLKANNEEYYIGVLHENLWLNSGSHAEDINGNGSKEDNFHFIVFETSDSENKYWVVYVDTNVDGDIGDEKPLRNYREKYDVFTLPNKNGLPKFSLGLNIIPENNTVSFYFDDGSHGTHCAGISAGNRIGDTELFGVAPGAYVMGLKIGNNNFAGGATVAESMKKAYLYADKISKEREEPCVINMSFGIGSEIEGHAEIELFLADLVENNPYLYIATSNGNEGPGLSTSGMPSASNAVFSTGAVLSEEVGNDLYGTTLGNDIILHFSSRGGELSKPDVVAPGACVSTVPNFSKKDRFWGTSMASPYSAGVMAVLLGAVKKEYPEVKVPSKLLFKVLRESAQPMKGYAYIDQGGGLIHIEAAYELLKKYIENSEINKFETYKVTSFAPNMPKSNAPNLYIRDASYLSGTETFNYKVERNNFNDTNKFYRIYDLTSNSDWLNVVQKKVHIRNEQPVYVDVNIDESILTSPGLYNGIIVAKRADKTKLSEFELMATVVVPYEFNSGNDYSISFENEKLAPGMHKRYFLKIPAGTSNLSILVDSDKKNFTSVRYYLHDPDGRKQLYGSLNAKSENGEKVDYFQDLVAGVYEFVILGQYTSSKESIFDLEFEIDGININDETVRNGKIIATNNFSKAKTYTLNGNLLGYKKSYKIKMNGEEKYKIPFKLLEGESKKTFQIFLEKGVFNKVTDFALMIYDKNGKAKKTGGHSYKDASITIKKSSEEKIEEYSFVLIPGFTHEPSNISFTVTENTYFSNPDDMVVKVDNKKSFKMYPDVKYNLNCKYKIPNKDIKDDEHFFAEISFTSKKTKDIEFTKIIKINK